MENTTKDRILSEALILFAENGYKGTNLRDLAARLGLSKSALYKHYESKEAIWNALLNKMEAYYTARFGSMSNLPPTPKGCEELVALTMRLIGFTIRDPQIQLTRKLLLTEQFHDARVCSLATKHFLEGLTNMFAALFGEMMQRGLLKHSDPAMLAFAFTSPITSLVHLYTREPDREAEIMERIEAFVRYFISVNRAEHQADSNAK